MNSVIVLVLLGVIWAAVLVPPWLQNRRNSRPAATMHSFHRELWALGRTAPAAGRRATPYGAVRFVSDDGRTTYGPVATHGPIVEGLDGLDEDDVDVLADHLVPQDDLAAAHGERRARLADAGLGYGEVPYADDRYPGDPADDEWLVDEAVSAGGGTVVHRADWGDAAIAASASAGAARWAERAPRRTRPVASAMAARRRAAAYQRRRRVLFVLVVSVVTTLTWAIVLAHPVLWVANVVADVLFVSYMALLIRRGRRTVERADKVRYLAPIEAPRPAVVVLHGGAAR